MKVAHIVLSILFLLFAIVQLNDSDPLLWIGIYSLVAVCFAFSAFRRSSKPIIIIGLVVCSVYFLYLFPDFLQWIKMGMPSITDSMKAESTYIELVREFLGLGICISALVYLLRQK